MRLRLARIAVVAAVPACCWAPAAHAGEPGLPAAADASVSARRPAADDPTRTRLRVGGRERWRTLLRFRVDGAERVTRATLRVFALRRPSRAVLARSHTPATPWREGAVTFATAPRRSVRAGTWRAPARCRRACGDGRWLSLDVSRAVRRPGEVSLVLLSADPATLLLAGRRDPRHAPRLVVARSRRAADAERPATGNRPGAPGAAGVPAGSALVAAAGDIACKPAPDDPCVQQATSELALASGAGTVLALGDLAYDDGTLEQFRTLFAPSWGRLGARLRPVPGNHEYHTPGAAGYFDFFNGPGAASGPAGERGNGWYSFDAGAWHVVALNSNCSKVGCGPGSPQEAWLRADLAASGARCTLAFWHHPRFSSGEHGDADAVTALWQALHDAGAELVLSGHDHDYERFAPMTAAGALDPARGVRQLVAGTGGRHLRPFRETRAGSEARDATTFGVLFLTLHPDRYDWRFSPAVGSYTDAGSTGCHE